MELARLAAFLEVEREGSMRAAARSLHLGQPALSARIAALEEELGVRVFDRNKRGVRLTLAGRALLQHGFDKLNLERIYCGMAATNVGMKKLAGALGMSLEGTRRQHLFLDGARVDVCDYGILRGEFKRPPSTGSQANPSSTAAS